MSQQERGIQLSRRRLLQLPAARGAGNLGALARTAEFVAQHPDQALSVAQKFATAIRNIFQPTPKPETPEIFQDRPEEAELSLQDRAANALTDMLQPHADYLRKIKLDPEAAIAPMSDYLLKVSDVPLFRASIILANPNPRYPVFELHDILEDPPGGEEISFQEATGAAIRRKHGGYRTKPDNDPRIRYADGWEQYSFHFISLMRDGPYSARQIPSRIVNGKSIEELMQKFSGMNSAKYKYLGTLLPVRE